jgi:DNA-binding NtrC family response regulator
MSAIKPTILIVDDERECRNAIRRTLRVDDYVIVEASSAHEALAYLWANHVDVMITDHSMPHMTGLELLRKVRTLRPRLQMIMVTGNADVETASALLNERLVYRLMLKPWDGSDLRVVVRMAVQEARFEKGLKLQSSFGSSSNMSLSR